MTEELTRERLERALGVLKLHHKMLVNEIDGMTHDINESIDAFAVGIALANAELERQSVTDEDVAEAIKWLKLIVVCEPARTVLPQQKAANLAIQALQAYRPVEVKDGDVAFAIEELEELNNSLKLSRDGQRELGDEKEAKGFDDWIFANELAIKVLKTYRPKREPCEYCRPRKAWEVPNDGIYAYQEVNTLGEIQGWSLSVYGGMICFGNAQGRPTYIANCPMCGRRLED
jgi:hypothetical protein